MFYINIIEELKDRSPMSEERRMLQNQACVSVYMQVSELLPAWAFWRTALNVDASSMVGVGFDG